MEFENKIALITGAGSGIGRAAALKLAAGGAKVCVSDVNLAGGQETVDLITQAGGEAIFAACDVSSATQVEQMVASAVQAFGGLDIAVNNAGVGGTMGLTHDLDEQVWSQVMDVNIKGVWLSMKYEIPHLLQREGATVINVASLAGLVGFPYNAVYSASKHAVIGLTKSAALEYASTGLRVNAICPGFTDTAMVQTMFDEVPSMKRRVERGSPVGRLGTVEEIADAVAYLVNATFTNGVALALDGGASAQ